jgi:hypothetical protein
MPATASSNGSMDDTVALTIARAKACILVLRWAGMCVCRYMYYILHLPFRNRTTWAMNCLHACICMHEKPLTRETHTPPGRYGRLVHPAVRK